MSSSKTAAGLPLALAVAALASAQPAVPAADLPTPQSVDEFRAAAMRILDEAGVPGAGIALVRADGIEWAGGIGLADLERGVPATADTHFLVGSIGKSFVGLALVQLSEDGLIDLDTPLAEAASEIVFDNPWEESEPVRVVHLLQHTAGWDDVHVRDAYAADGEREPSIADRLRPGAAARRSRWPPGTRMSYSNPGYAAATLVLEKASAQRFADYITDHIMQPVGMATSTFVRTPEAEGRLARGYDHASGPPVPWPDVYLWPGESLQSSAAELGRFVQMLLLWGEIDDEFVVDPEYLSNMEHVRTTLASRAGLRIGYGSGVFWWVDQPYALIGHHGRVDGFSAGFGYSPARDSGIVVLTNGGNALAAVERIMALGMRYLKRGIEPAVPPPAAVDGAALAAHEGYYHDADLPNRLLAFLSWLGGGRTVTVEDGHLRITPVVGEAVTLVAVSDRLFRIEHQIDATHVFTTDDEGRPVLTGVRTGGGLYAERVPRWRVEMVRGAVAASLAVAGTVPLAAIVWIARARRVSPRGFWGLKTAVLAVPVVLLIPALAARRLDLSGWATLNVWTALTFLATLALPALAMGVAALASGTARAGGGRWLVAYATAVALAAGTLSLYLAFWGLLGFRSWMY